MKDHFFVLVGVLFFLLLAVYVGSTWNLVESEMSFVRTRYLFLYYLTR